MINKTKNKRSKKSKKNATKKLFEYMKNVGGRRNNGMMMMGGVPFDSIEYRKKREQARLVDKGYQRNKQERQKSHELNNNMIILKDGTTIINNPKNPSLFSKKNTKPTPSYKILKDGKFVDPTPQQMEELKQKLKENDEKFQEENEKLDRQDEENAQMLHEAEEKKSKQVEPLPAVPENVAASTAASSTLPPIPADTVASPPAALEAPAADVALNANAPPPAALEAPAADVALEDALSSTPPLAALNDNAPPPAALEDASSAAPPLAALNDNAPPPAALEDASSAAPPPAVLEAPPAPPDDVALNAPPAVLEAPPAALEDATAIDPVEKVASAPLEEASSSSPPPPPAELKDAGAAPLVSSDKLPENNLNTSNDDASKQLQKALELRAKLDNTIDYLKTLTSTESKTLTASDGVSGASTESKTLTTSDGASTESKTLTASDGVSGASTESKTLTASDGASTESKTLTASDGASGASTGAESGGGKKKKINKTRYKKYNSNMSLKRKHKTNKNV